MTTCPALTTVCGSLTKVLDSAEICTRPSWCTPISTKAPKAATLVTTPSRIMSGRKSLISSTPSLKVAVVNSGRGSRPGFSSSFRMSVMVGIPNFSSAYLAGLSDFRIFSSPMMLFTSFLISARIFSTSG
ncbi:hypothetical protein D3C81_1838950 [compost metagenome]